MAVGVGFLVGDAIRVGGRGIDNVFGLAGTALSLVGGVLGNLFRVVTSSRSSATLPA